LEEKQHNSMAKNDLLYIHPKRILVCQLRQIGDVVLTSHIPEMLKKKFPDAAIDFFTEKKCAPVLDHNPFISEIKILDKSNLTHFGKELAAYWRIARNGYDLVIDFQQLPRCRFVVLFSRAAVRFTFPPPWYNRWLYTHWTEVENGHAAIRKAHLLKPLGIEWQGEMPRICLTRNEQVWAEQFLSRYKIDTRDILITVAPTHHSATRRWPAEHYGNLIRMAIAQKPHIKCVLFHGPGERECAEKVARMAGSPGHCILPDAMLSLREMAAVIDKARLHLGNCSSPRHIAVAMDTPTLSIIGSAGTGWTFPNPMHTHVLKGLFCQPCKQGTCVRGDIACLRNLAPEAVLPQLLHRIESDL
jgi:heptosyltransferase-2/heptosyltransferase-3